MKILLGALTLLAVTSTWAESLYQPLAGPGEVGAYGADSLYTPIQAPEYGTSTRVITGHDGSRYVEVAPSYTPHDEVRVIDYSTPYISDRALELEGQFQRFDLE